MSYYYQDKRRTEWNQQPTQQNCELTNDEIGGREKLKKKRKELKKLRQQEKKMTAYS